MQPNGTILCQYNEPLSHQYIEASDQYFETSDQVIDWYKWEKTITIIEAYTNKKWEKTITIIETYTNKKRSDLNITKNLSWSLW